MSPKALPMSIDLATHLVDWFHEERLYLLEIEQQPVMVRAVPPGPVFEYLNSVLEPGLLMPSQDGWIMFETAVLVEVAHAQLVLREYLSGQTEQAAAILQTRPPASTLEPAPSVEAEKEEDPDDGNWGRPEDAIDWPLCDRNRIDTELSTLKSQDKRKPTLERWRWRPERWLPRAKREHFEKVAALEDAFPNFKEVIEGLRGHLARQAVCGGAIQLPPTLLLGPPGVGKTLFGQRLAEVLGAHLVFHSLAELTAGFAITGLTQGWANGGPGLIARALLDLPDGQPLIILFDELDKARQDSTHPTDSTLLGLLDPVTSQAFRDEFLDLPLDISPVSFLFTANRTEGIRPELTSRMEKIDVPLPTTAQMPAIVRSVDAVLRARQPELERHFAPLADSLIATLASQSPRDLMRLLDRAYDRAAEDSLSRKGRKRIIRIERRHLQADPEDIPLNGNGQDPSDGPSGSERVH